MSNNSCQLRQIKNRVNKPSINSFRMVVFFAFLPRKLHSKCLDMRSKFRFLLCLFGLCGLFRVNLISAQIDSDELENPTEDQFTFYKSIKPIENSAHFLAPQDGFNFYVKSIKKVIETTSKVFKGLKPLTFFTPLDETFLINQTIRSLDVRTVNAVTVATATGGILGDGIYEFHHYYFLWQNHLCNATHNLEVKVFYFNSKYGSYEKALDHPDGILVAIVPIATNGDCPNPMFNAFYKILHKKIKQPGDCTKVHSAFTYIWFVNFPYGSIYHTTKDEFIDEEFGKTYKAIVIFLPLDSRLNFISKKQFANTFGKIKGVSEQFSNGDFFAEDRVMSMERRKGVCIVNLPA